MLLPDESTLPKLVQATTIVKHPIATKSESNIAVVQTS